MIGSRSIALTLVMALNRRIHRAYNRMRDGNFSIDGLLGFDLHGETIGIIGIGKIGSVLAGLSAPSPDPISRISFGAVW